MMLSIRHQAPVRRVDAATVARGVLVELACGVSPMSRRDTKRAVQEARRLLTGHSRTAAFEVPRRARA